MVGLRALQALRHQHRGILSRLRESTLNGFLITETVKNHGGQDFAKVVAVHQPTLQTFELLDYIHRACRAVIIRSDFATDFFESPDAMERWLTKHVVLKYRRSNTVASLGKPPKVIGTFGGDGWVYLTDQSVRLKAGMRRSRRDVVIYRSKPGARKPHNISSPYIHLELRLQQADAVRRAGILKPSDAIRLNPAELFARNIALVDMRDGKARFIQRKQRKAVAGAKFSLDESTIGDRYRANLHRRIEGHYMRVTQDRAQEWRARYGIKGVCLPFDELGIPTALTVPSMSTSMSTSISALRSANSLMKSLAPRLTTGTNTSRANRVRLRLTSDQKVSIHRVRL